MSKKIYIFSNFEFLIAWRYLRSKRAEGGVGTMTWISVVGISLSVFALIATLSVRSGFRAELVDTILGANAHVTVYKQPTKDSNGNVYRGFKDYESASSIISSLNSVSRAAPLIRGQVMASANDSLFSPFISGMVDKHGHVTNDSVASQQAPIIKDDALLR